MTLKVGMGVRYTNSFVSRITDVFSNGGFAFLDPDGVRGAYTVELWRSDVLRGDVWLIPSLGDRVLGLDGIEWKVAQAIADTDVALRRVTDNHYSVISLNDFSLGLARGYYCMVPDPVAAPAPTKPRPEPIHIEVLRPHGRKIHNIPQSVLDAAIDRGERAIRRIGREWPYGMVSTLERVECDGELHLKWRFEADPETETE